MRINLFKITAIYLLLFSLAACSGSVTENALEISTNDSENVTNNECGTNIYTITWNWTTNDSSTTTLTGFKIYYGTSSGLTKTNAAGSILLGRGSYSVDFTPADYKITDCSSAYLGITAVGSQPESAISSIINLANSS